MPGRTLTRNSQCQDQVWVIQPPTSGPTVGASTAMTPASVVATPCWRKGNSRKTAENTDGISTPPAKPCTTRATISVSKPPLAAQAAEATVNRQSAPTNSQRRLSTRVSRPVSGIAITSAMR